MEPYSMNGAENNYQNNLKRPIEDSYQAGVTSQSNPMMYNDGGPPEAKRAVPESFCQEANPGLTTEDFPVPDNMVGLIIGRGGDQITKIQADTGCRVAVVPQPTGQSHRPCTLTGTPEQIALAKDKLTEIISRGQTKVEPQTTHSEDFGGHPAPSANELMNQNVAATAAIDGNTIEEIVIPHDKCGIVIGKNGNTLRNLRSQFGCSVNLDSTVDSGGAKPLRIAGPPDKVNLVVAEVHKMMAAKENISHTKVPPGQDQVTFMIPKVSVGVVIGKSGETINRIQEQTLTRIQFVPDDPKITDRGCYIIGPQEGCLEAQREVLEIVKKKMEEVGNAKSMMPKLVFDGKRYVKQDQLGGDAGSMGEQQVDYPVPANRAGVVIGKGGETINQIKEKSGAFVQINKTPPQDHPDWKYFTIRGNSNQIAHAQKLIQEKVGGPAPPGAAISNSPQTGGYQYQNGGGGSSGGGYGGGQQGGQSYGGQQGGYGQSGAPQQDYSAAWAQYYAQMGQQQTQQAQPTQDYSKAWEEYFKKTGQTPQQYQAMQQQQSQQQAPQQAAAAAPQQAAAPGQGAGAAGGQDYSAQWAEYYRKLAEYHKTQPK